MSAEVLLAGLPSNYIDLIITSPPYDNLRTYQGFQWSFETIAQQSYRVLKPGGILVWIVGDATINGSETLTSFKQALYFKEECGFNMHDTMIWQKDGSPFPESNRYAQEFEYNFIFSKGTPKSVNLLQKKVTYHPGKSATYRQRNGTMASNQYGIRDTRALANIWYIPCGYMKTTTDKMAYCHVAMFPEVLAERHIQTWSNPGDIVLDYFIGSGTTGKVAAKLGRHYIGCDIAPEYVALARQRIANADPFQDSVKADGVKQLSLFAGAE